MNKENNVFKLLYSEYKNKNYKSLLRYFCSISFICGTISSMIFMQYTSWDSFTLSISTLGLFLTLFMSIVGLHYEKGFLKKAKTKEIKNYLSKISDEQMKEEKAAQIVSKMIKNKNMNISLNDFDDIQNNSGNLTISNDIKIYKDIIDNLLEKGILNQKNKQEVY